MAGVADQALRHLGPWPDGVNNVAAEDNLPRDQNGNVTSIRAAVNVDIDQLGWSQRRDGYVNRVAAARAHSLFATHERLLAVIEKNLVALDANLAPTTVRAAIGDSYASFAQVHEDVYWSNGLQIRRLTDALVDCPVWLDTPAAPQAAASSSGGLVAGDYAISLTWRANDGLESGASSPVVVTVADNGGVMLTNLPAAAEGAAWLRAYMTPPDGDVPYFAYEIPAGQSALMLGAHTPGKALETQWLVPLPPGQYVRFWNGRVFVAALNVLCWSEALRFGLMHQDSTLRFGERITMLEPVGEGGDGAGIFVSDHKRTYFMDGGKPDEWKRTIRYGYPAVPGTSLTVPGTVFGLDSAAPVAFWLATNGVFCLGLPGGTVQPIRENQLSLPEGEHGATMYREHDGMRQMLTSFLAGDSNNVAATDSISATVRRNGVTV